MTSQILIADDHLIVRQGVRALLEREGMRVVGEARDGHTAVRMARELRPDIAVLDLGMPSLNGIDAAREIMHDLPGTKTILLTMHEEDQYILEALRIGVHGYVLKRQAV
ncbi:MAG TPA: response regulator transcription factor, partial [Candidatus Polarisedimenticolia bacterium]